MSGDHSFHFLTWILSFRNIVMKAREREGGRGSIYKRFGGGVLLDLNQFDTKSVLFSSCFRPERKIDTPSPRLPRSNKTNTLFQTKMALICIFFRPKPLENQILWGHRCQWSPYKGVPRTAGAPRASEGSQSWQEHKWWAGFQIARIRSVLLFGSFQHFVVLIFRTSGWLD